MTSSATKTATRTGQPGPRPSAKRDGVLLSALNEDDDVAGGVRFHVADGSRHAVPASVIATEVCVSILGSYAALADWLEVSRSQPGRWLSGAELPSAQSERLVLDLAYVIDRARQVWDRDAALRSWLMGVDALLDDASPIDVVRLGDPTSVVKAIDAHLAGSYA